MNAFSDPGEGGSLVKCVARSGEREIYPPNRIVLTITCDGQECFLATLERVSERGSDGQATYLGPGFRALTRGGTEGIVDFVGRFLVQEASKS